MIEPRSLSYFVVMRDFPAQRAREAIVNPEHTRRDIVALIRSREWDNVLFVHEVAVGAPVRDLTSEILDEAGLGEPLRAPDTDSHYAARMRRLAGIA